MSKFWQDEYKSVLCGDMIGRGIARSVYRMVGNYEYVVKVEGAGGSFQNIAEWEAWTWLSGGPYQKWLAPCERVSTCGAILIQRFAHPVARKHLPDKIPSILTDIKQENFGMIDGRVVCFDYGTILASLRKVPSRMAKVKW